jgi:NAD(P)-dependent dehydrogenase (short-subunit alcohol dehydrogenase family)
MITPQQPINSPFDAESTAAEVIAGHDLSGKTAFVTGGYSGIGTETVRALVGAGARVIIGGRRPELAKETLADIIDQVSVVTLELSDPSAIDACAAQVASLTPKIDLLINNAAIMACPLARDVRGYESQFATNHLGHFQLSARLWPLVRAAGSGARVVALSSLAHKRGGFDPNDPHYERRDYEKWAAYGQAKTANALFARHLDTLAAPHGIRAFSVHPGGIQTNLGRYLTKEDLVIMNARASGAEVGGAPAIVWKNPEQGAATTIWAATAPQLNGKGGVYCEDCNIAQLLAPGEKLSSGVAAHACDAEMAAKLWTMSEEMIGIAFP